MNSKQTQVQRADREAKRVKEEFASELRRGLLLLRYLGHCKCGLVLTERDLTKKKNTYSCPHCGASGPLAGVA